jgi:glycosyltransferase involved in cell wall biosynthesis
VNAPLPLIAIGACHRQTGFTRVLWSILSRLGPRFDVHYIGIGYKGERVQTGGVTLHPCNLRGGDVFGAYQGAALAQEIGARAVLCLNDLWMLKNYITPFAPILGRVPVVMYVPLDGRLPDDQLIAPFPAIDCLVAYTQFGRHEILRGIASLEAGGARFASREIEVIPHGVDTELFRPLAGDIDRQLEPGARQAWRRQAFPDRPDLWDAFLVLNANRPVPRKRVDLTIEGFAQFARHAPRAVKLVLHHAIMNGDERAQILAWAEAAGIGDRLVLSSSSASSSAAGASVEVMTDERLNLLYNACDVGVNTAMGEGWGLVSLEHAATGAAQIVPRHSACEEIWNGAALLLDPVKRMVPAFALLEMAAVWPDALAAALDVLYEKPSLLRALSRDAYNRATRPEWTWTRVAEQWQQLLLRLVEERAGNDAGGNAAPPHQAMRSSPA